MPEVEYIRPELEQMLPAIRLVEDVIGGPTVVKDHKETYLPKPDPTNKSPENKERYSQYIDRAQLLGATPQTLEALMGQVFAKDPVTTFPTGLDLLETDVDSKGKSFDTLCKEGLRMIFKQSRVGFFIDYPQKRVPEGDENKVLSKADVEANGLRPRIIIYASDKIVNWRTDSDGLVMVNLKEEYQVDDDGFKQSTACRYRKLYLKEKICICEIWQKTEGGNGWEVTETTIPLDSKGQPFSEIPFVFAGWRDNGPNPDPIPLEALARLEIAHYRNSADYEESCYICGQPTPVFAGLTEDWVNNVMDGTVRLGSRAAVPLPDGGSATLLQAAPNSMPKEAMELKELQMSKIGAKLIEPTAGARTATEATLDASAESSILGSAAKNLSTALEAAIGYAALYVGIEIPEGEGQEEVLSIELNTDFSFYRVSAQERQVLMAEWQGGALTFEEYRFNLKKAGVAYLDDEAAKDQIATAEIA